MWRKKIEKDVHHGVPLEEFSVKAEKRRRGERMVSTISILDYKIRKEEMRFLCSRLNMCYFV